VDSNNVKQQICGIVQKYIKLDVGDESTATPLSMRPYLFDSVALAGILLDVQKSFGLDFNKMFETSFDFSIDSIVSAVVSQHA